MLVPKLVRIVQSRYDVGAALPKLEIQEGLSASIEQYAANHPPYFPTAMVVEEDYKNQAKGLAQQLRPAFPHQRTDCSNFFGTI